MEKKRIKTERKKETDRLWEENNKEYRKKYQQEYIKKNKKRIQKRDHEKYLKNREKKLTYQKEYSKTSEGKTNIKKRDIKRRRELGFIPLNEPFKNSHGHHINDEEIIYIPKELHMRFPHNHKKIETMVIINTAIIEWLKEL